MLQKLRNRKQGFTLIELLIVVAIIGIIAALLIPNFLDALQKAKQKRTVADARNLGTAMMSWVTDQASAAAAGASTWDQSDYTTSRTATELETILVPQYIQLIPTEDGWGTDYVFGLNDESEVLAAHVMFIKSLGRDKAESGTTYSSGSFEPTDYDQDIVWADGYFVRWPGKTNQQP